MIYIILKALHIIFMVSYFAGIFYLVRLFVYYKDTESMSEEKQKILKEQYVFMLRRLWNIIIIPAGILMLGLGISILFVNQSLLKTPWFHLKILFLLALGGYHFWIWKKLLHLISLKGKNLKNSSIFLRQINEIATFLLFLIVFTAVLKQNIITHGIELFLYFLGLVLVIMSIVKLVNRKKK